MTQNWEGIIYKINKVDADIKDYSRHYQHMNKLRTRDAKKELDKTFDEFLKEAQTNVKTN